MEAQLRASRGAGCQGRDDIPITSYSRCKRPTRGAATEGAVACRDTSQTRSKRRLHPVEPLTRLVSASMLVSASCHSGQHDGKARHRKGGSGDTVCCSPIHRGRRRTLSTRRAVDLTNCAHDVSRAGDRSSRANAQYQYRRHSSYRSCDLYPGTARPANFQNSCDKADPHRPARCLDTVPLATSPGRPSLRDRQSLACHSRERRAISTAARLRSEAHLSPSWQTISSLVRGHTDPGGHAGEATRDPVRTLRAPRPSNTHRIPSKSTTPLGAVSSPTMATSSPAPLSPGVTLRGDPGPTGMHGPAARAAAGHDQDRCNPFAQRTGLEEAHSRDGIGGGGIPFLCFLSSFASGRSNALMMPTPSSDTPLMVESGVSATGSTDFPLLSHVDFTHVPRSPQSLRQISRPSSVCSSTMTPSLPATAALLGALTKFKGKITVTAPPAMGVSGGRHRHKARLSGSAKWPGDCAGLSHRMWSSQGRLHSIGRGPSPSSPDPSDFVPASWSSLPPSSSASPKNPPSVGWESANPQPSLPRHSLGVHLEGADIALSPPPALGAPEATPRSVPSGSLSRGLGGSTYDERPPSIPFCRNVRRHTATLNGQLLHSQQPQPCSIRVFFITDNMVGRMQRMVLTEAHEQQENETLPLPLTASTTTNGTQAETGTQEITSLCESCFTKPAVSSTVAGKPSTESRYTSSTSDGEVGDVVEVDDAFAAAFTRHLVTCLRLEEQRMWWQHVSMSTVSTASPRVVFSSFHLPTVSTYHSFADDERASSRLLRGPGLSEVESRSEGFRNAAASSENRQPGSETTLWAPVDAHPSCGGPVMDLFTPSPPLEGDVSSTMPFLSGLLLTPSLMNRAPARDPEQLRAREWHMPALNSRLTGPSTNSAAQHFLPMPQTVHASSSCGVTAAVAAPSIMLPVLDIVVQCLPSGVALADDVAAPTEGSVMNETGRSALPGALPSSVPSAPPPPTSTSRLSAAPLVSSAHHLGERPVRPGSRSGLSGMLNEAGRSESESRHSSSETAAHGTLADELGGFSATHTGATSPPQLCASLVFPSVQQGNIRDLFSEWVQMHTPAPPEREAVLRQLIHSVLRCLHHWHQTTGRAHGGVKSTNVFSLAHATLAVAATSWMLDKPLHQTTPVSGANSTNERVTPTTAPADRDERQACSCGAPLVSSLTHDGSSLPCMCPLADPYPPAGLTATLSDVVGAATTSSPVNDETAEDLSHPPHFHTRGVSMGMTTDAVAAAATSCANPLEWSKNVVLMDGYYDAVEEALRRTVTERLRALHRLPSPASYAGGRRLHMDMAGGEELSPTAATGVQTHSNNLPELQSTLLSRPRECPPSSESVSHTWSNRLNLFSIVEAEVVPPPECITQEAMEDVVEPGASESLRRRPIRRAPNTMYPRTMLDPASDVWMVGMLAIELAEGSFPSWLTRQHVPLPRLSRGAWSPPFHLFVQRCLCVDLAKRATVGELLLDPWFSVPLGPGTEGKGLAAADGPFGSERGPTQRMATGGSQHDGSPVSFTGGQHGPDASIDPLKDTGGGVGGPVSSISTFARRPYIDISFTFCKTVQRFSIRQAMDKGGTAERASTYGRSSPGGATDLRGGLVLPVNGSVANMGHSSLGVGCPAVQQLVTTLSMSTPTYSGLGGHPNSGASFASVPHCSTSPPSFLKPLSVATSPQPDYNSGFWSNSSAGSDALYEDLRESEDASEVDRARELFDDDPGVMPAMVSPSGRQSDVTVPVLEASTPDEGRGFSKRAVYSGHPAHMNLTARPSSVASHAADASNVAVRERMAARWAAMPSFLGTFSTALEMAADGASCDTAPPHPENSVESTAHNAAVAADGDRAGRRGQLMQAFWDLHRECPLAAEIWSHTLLQQLAADDSTVSLVEPYQHLLLAPGRGELYKSPAEDASQVREGENADAPGKPTTGPPPVEDTCPSLFNHYEVSKWVAAVAVALDRSKSVLSKRG